MNSKYPSECHQARLAGRQSVAAVLAMRGAVEAREVRAVATRERLAVVVREQLALATGTLAGNAFLCFCTRSTLWVALVRLAFLEMWMEMLY